MPVACGYAADCPPAYRPEEVNASAALWHLCNATGKQLLENQRERAAKACSRTSTTGGYCLPHLEVMANGEPRVASGLVRRIELPHNQSYLLPYDPTYQSANHYEADGRVVATLAAMALASPRHGLFLNDLGAGVGQYGHALLSIQPTAKYRGYDGAGNVRKWTNGFVHWVDLTMPMSLPRAQWVMSIEVGEHIPSRFEGAFFRNLHAHNCVGVILSWAALAQDGQGHINNHKSSYVAETMRSLGYFVNANLTNSLRRGAAIPGMPYTARVKNIAAFERFEHVSPCTALPPQCAGR